MQYKYIVIDDTGNMQLHGHMFETETEAQSFIDQHKLGATHLIYNLNNAVPSPSTAQTLMDLIASELESASETEAIVEAVMAKHGDDYDPWTEIMEDGNGYPDDNYANASIYAWLLHDHLQYETVLWDYDTVAKHTEMGSSGYDGWTHALEHLVHIGLMSPREI